MTISASLLARARSNARSRTNPVSLTLAGTVSQTQSTSEMQRRIADLEARLAKLENVLFIASDGSVIVYAQGDLALYAERVAQLSAAQRFSVYTDQCSIDGTGGSIQINAGTLKESAQRHELNSTVVKINAGTLEESADHRHELNSTVVKINAGTLEESAQDHRVLSDRLYVEGDLNVSRVMHGGLIMCDTIKANSVLGTSYAPGAGNIL